MPFTLSAQQTLGIYHLNDAGAAQKLHAAFDAERSTATFFTQYYSEFIIEAEPINPFSDVVDSD